VSKWVYGCGTHYFDTSILTCPLLAAKHSLTNTATVTTLLSALSNMDMFLSRIAPDWLFSIGSKVKILTSLYSLFILATVDPISPLPPVWWFV
jgi:hypothetical protein